MFFFQKKLKNIFFKEIITIMSPESPTSVVHNFTQEEESNMEWNIDQDLSLYIPYVENRHANEEYIRNIFYYLNIGDVKRVDFQPKTNVYLDTSDDKVAFVHMERWFNNVCVHNLQERILDENNEARIVHDDPHYWVLLRNKRPIPENFSEQLSLLCARINTLEQKNMILETTIGQMQWWIHQNNININFLNSKFNNAVQAIPISQSNSKTTTLPPPPPSPNDQYNNSSVNISNIWSNRLRTRNTITRQISSHEWNNRLRPCNRVNYNEDDKDDYYNVKRSKM
tara:strand:- start:23909 stop:24757 length:849 start_codon:yes stop_codon:yes gene_type:complete